MLPQRDKCKEMTPRRLHWIRPSGGFVGCIQKFWLGLGFGPTWTPKVCGINGRLWVLGQYFAIFGGSGAQQLY